MTVEADYSIPMESVDYPDRLNQKIQLQINRGVEGRRINDPNDIYLLRRNNKPLGKIKYRDIPFGAWVHDEPFGPFKGWLDVETMEVQGGAIGDLFKLDELK